MSGLPPWGQMDEALLKRIKSKFIPRDWKPTDNSMVSRNKKWVRWRDSVIADIAQLLWPVYTPEPSLWESSRVRSLFDADFTLLAQLHPKLRTPIRALYPTTVTQADLFSEEDDESKQFATGYERYDPGLSAELRAQLPDLLDKGLAYKVATLHLQMKQRFQRPRPYQVAVIQRRGNFSYVVAKSADTPSLVSGHCLQSSLGACAAFNTLHGQLGRRSLDIFLQFAVDIGDRRVLAGVHYPSDNLSSWYTAFRLLPHVFPQLQLQRTRSFLWKAITRKSIVYQAVRSHVGRVKNSPYKPILLAISRLAR